MYTVFFSEFSRSLSDGGWEQEREARSAVKIVRQNGSSDIIGVDRSDYRLSKEIKDRRASFSSERFQELELPQYRGEHTYIKVPNNAIVVLLSSALHSDKIPSIYTT